MFSRAFVVGLLVSFCGCDDPSKGADGGSTQQDAGALPPAGSADAYCAEYARAVCERMSACGMADPNALEACRAIRLRTCDLELGRYVRAGTLALATGATEVCAQVIQNVSCREVGWHSGVRGCLYGDDIETAAADPGERCEWSEQCVGGYCDADATCSTCVAYTAIGQPCSFCDPATAYCQLPYESDGGTPLCVERLSDGAECRSRSQCRSEVCNLNDRCGPTSTGSACRHTYECAPTDFCKGYQPEPTTSGVCSPRYPSGASCARETWDPWGGCQVEEFCLDGACRTAAAGTLDEGAQCAYWPQCAAGLFCLGAFPPVDLGHCTRFPGAGEPCLDEQDVCEHTARCMTDADGGRTCIALKSIGAPCTTQDSRRDDCLAGLACFAHADGGTSCQPLRPVGGACATNAHCTSSRCVAGSCQAPAGEGAECLEGSECQSGWCGWTGAETSGACRAACFE